MRSSNPVFRNLEKQNHYELTATATKTGIAGKTFLLLMLTLVSGFLTIFLPVDLLMGALIFSGIVAFISVLVVSFSPRMAMPFSMVYAIATGLTYGTITWILESMFPGVAVTALIGTASIFIIMLTLYNTGVLRGSALLRSVVLGSLIAILIGSLIISITSLVSPGFLNAFSNNYELSIGISLLMIVLGAFMITLDLENADQVVKMGLDKKFEWQVALGFMVTLVWIYYNVLRLAVTILARNNN